MTTQADKRPPNRTKCLGCAKEWGGLLACHCAVCHETFTSTTGFDKHRTGSHAAGKRHCLPVDLVRYGPDNKRAGEPMFVDAGRAYPCWALSGEDSRWD